MEKLKAIHAGHNRALILTSSIPLSHKGEIGMGGLPRLQW